MIDLATAEGRKLGPHHILGAENLICRESDSWTCTPKYSRFVHFGSVLGNEKGWHLFILMSFCLMT